MTYELHDTFILRLADGAHIPIADGNRDYAQYRAWVAEGNSATLPAAQPPSVPQVVSRFQARAALHLAGLLSQVETMMSDPATDPIARIAWTDAQEFRRTSPTVQMMGALLALSDAQIDDLFVSASGVEA